MITVLNTGVSNLNSVLYCLERLGIRYELSDSPDKISKGRLLILPGVGTANAFMDKMKGLELVEVIQKTKVPLMGICLGMQVLFSESEEGNVKTVGVLPGKVRKMNPGTGYPVPHMGWNQVSMVRPSALLSGIPNNSYFYFVHSFCCPEGNNIVGESDYGLIKIPAVVEIDNWFGVQFHPERSGAVGEKLIKNFANL